jgi:hypothetical protein
MPLAFPFFLCLGRVRGEFGRWLDLSILSVFSDQSRTTLAEKAFDFAPVLQGSLDQGNQRQGNIHAPAPAFQRVGKHVRGMLFLLEKPPLFPASSPPLKALPPGLSSDPIPGRRLAGLQFDLGGTPVPLGLCNFRKGARSGLIPSLEGPGSLPEEARISAEQAAG